MSPRDAKTALFLEAEKLRLAKRFDQAIPIFQKILKLDPTDVGVRKTLAGLYLVTGSHERGLQEYGELAKQLFDLGRPDECRSILRRLGNIDKAGSHAGLVDDLERRLDKAKDGPGEAAVPSKSVAKAAASASEPRTATGTGEIPVADFTMDDMESALEEVEAEASDMNHSSASLSNVLFTSLAPDTLNDVIRACEKKQYGRGDAIYEEGSSSRSLYVVGHGIVDVRKPTKPGPIAVSCGRHSAGEIFGEAALLAGTPREATAVAATDALCYRLSQGAAEKIMAAHPDFGAVVTGLYKRRILKAFLQSIPSFRNLSEASCSDLLEAFEPQRLPMGRVLIREGQRGDDLFFVQSGELSVATRVGGKTIELTRVRKHHLLGEISFLTGAPRTATVTAVTESRIFRVAGDKLRAMASKYQELEQALREVHLAHASDAARKIAKRR